MEAFLGRLFWETRRLRRRLGLVGALGAGGVLGAALVLLGFWWPERAALHRAQVERTALLAAPTRSAASAPSVSSDPGSQLASFYQFLAPEDSVPKALQGIEAAAAENGVALSAGEFKLIVDAGSRVGRYQMVFPVRAGYRQIRSFLRQTLKENPHLALEEIGMRRDSASSQILDTRVRLALYLLEGP